jgi:DNA-binding response OmpR family regulator
VQFVSKPFGARTVSARNAAAIRRGARAWHAAD